MNKIKQLEIKKLLRELDFIESDFIYKNELVQEADNSFIRSVNDLLIKHPDLKDIFDKKINSKIENVFKKRQEIIKGITESDEKEISLDEFIDEIVEQTSFVEVEIEVSKIKKLYREIVKRTHPDKVSNKKLNELYLKSTFFYEANDIAGIYSICDELDLDYEVDEKDNKMIVDKINSLKSRITFMESTITWKWFHSEDEKEKEQLVLRYIENQLNN
jgi:hypothetical protein